MESVVYMATCALNGHRYIGVTSRALEKRIRQHRVAAFYGTGNKGAPLFYRAIRKHGAENFSWAILSTHQHYAEALAAEVALISQLKPEYNITAGGQGATGNKLSDDAKRKIRDSRLGKPMPPATRKALEPIWEAKRAARDLRNAGRVKRLYPQRPVICLDDGVIFKTIADCAREYRLRASAIHGVCSGKAIKTGGKHFKFYDGVVLSADDRTKIINDLHVSSCLRRKSICRTDEWKAKIARTLTGRKRPPGVIAKLTGRKRSEETRIKLQKLGLERIAIWREYSHLGPKAMSRAVICLDDGLSWESASAAARHYSIAKSAIIELCRGQRGRKTVGGLRFAYKEK